MLLVPVRAYLEAGSLRQILLEARASALHSAVELRNEVKLYNDIVIS